MGNTTFRRVLFFVGGTLAQRSLIASAAAEIAGLATRLRPEEWTSYAARRYLDTNNLIIVNEVESHELSSIFAEVISRNADVYGNDGLSVKTLDKDCLITGSSLPLIAPAMAIEIAPYISVVNLDRYPVNTSDEAHALIENEHGRYPGWKIEGGKRSSPLAITPAAKAWLDMCIAAADSDA